MGGMARGLILCAMMSPFLGIAYYVSGGPVLDWIAAKGWEATPCVILHSGLDGRTQSGKKTKYRIEMRYEFDWEGVSYRGDRYQFSVGRTAGREGKQVVVDAYPKGSEATCYVDSDNPARSVFDRSLPYDVLYGAFPLAIPALVFGAAIRNRFRENKAHP